MGETTPLERLRAAYSKHMEISLALRAPHVLVNDRDLHAVIHAKSDTLRAMFFFGSMRDDRVREAVLGHPVEDMPSYYAVLDDHVALVIAGESYPTLRYSFGESLTGKVVEGLTDDDLARIEFWEDNEYGLAVMTVHDANGTGREALVYATSQHESSRTPWDFEKFEAGVPEYLAEVREWMERFDG